MIPCVLLLLALAVPLSRPIYSSLPSFAHLPLTRLSSQALLYPRLALSRHRTSSRRIKSHLHDTEALLDLALGSLPE